MKINGWVKISDNSKFFPFYQGRSVCMHSILVTCGCEHDFEWAFSFHSAANFHNALLFLVLPFYHTSEGCTYKHLWAPISFITFPSFVWFLCQWQRVVTDGLFFFRYSYAHAMLWPVYLWLTNEKVAIRRSLRSHCEIRSRSYAIFSLLLQK